jgi:hypothetical protein
MCHSLAGRAFWEKIHMAAVWLLSLAAAFEAATGLALIAFPQAVSRLLLGADLAGAGIVVGRIAGVALLSLGLVCWLSRQKVGKKAVLTAMLAYNLPVTAYLMYLRIAGELVGILLWPAIVIHAAFTIWFVLAWSSDQRTKPTTQ